MTEMINKGFQGILFKETDGEIKYLDSVFEPVPIPEDGISVYVSDLKIPHWWAIILNRILLPYGNPEALSVNTPLYSDYRNMIEFWEDLQEELGFDIWDWCEKELTDEDFEKWQSTWSEADFILGYLNPLTQKFYRVFVYKEDGEKKWN